MKGANYKKIVKDFIGRLSKLKEYTYYLNLLTIPFYNHGCCAQLLQAETVPFI